MKTVDTLMAEAFHAARDARSIEYREGCRALLERRIHGKMVHCPYRTGTASYDAYWAGVDEGWAIWRELDVPSLVPPKPKAP